MNHSEERLKQYEQDFNALAQLEASAESDLSQVEHMPTWAPSRYECEYLPALRQVGIRRKSQAVLQNTADLHMHTQWSDGDDLNKVLAQALNMRLDVIAITDHDVIDGAFEARRRAHQRRLPLAVVPGTEISSRDGHIGALFVMQTFPQDLSAEETVALIHKAGGIAVAHHPFSPRWLDHVLRVRLGCGELIRSVGFDAVECTNAVPGRGVKYNMAAIEAMRRHHVTVAVTGGSDAHNARFVGKGKTYFAGNHGVVSLKRALHYGFTQGAEGYWKTSEKLLYYSTLMRAIVRNAVKKVGSVN